MRQMTHVDIVDGCLEPIFGIRVVKSTRARYDSKRNVGSLSVLAKSGISILEAR